MSKTPSTTSRAPAVRQGKGRPPATVIDKNGGPKLFGGPSTFQGTGSFSGNGFKDGDAAR
jgi:hypothetical protein